MKKKAPYLLLLGLSGTDASHIVCVKGKDILKCDKQIKTEVYKSNTLTFDGIDYKFDFKFNVEAVYIAQIDGYFSNNNEKPEMKKIIAQNGMAKYENSLPIPTKALNELWYNDPSGPFPFFSGCVKPTRSFDDRRCKHTPFIIYPHTKEDKASIQPRTLIGGETASIMLESPNEIQSPSFKNVRFHNSNFLILNKVNYPGKETACKAYSDFHTCELDQEYNYKYRYEFYLPMKLKEFSSDPHPYGIFIGGDYYVGNRNLFDVTALPVTLIKSENYSTSIEATSDVARVDEQKKNEKKESTNALRRAINDNVDLAGKIFDLLPSAGKTMRMDVVDRIMAYMISEVSLPMGDHTKFMNSLIADLLKEKERNLEKAKEREKGKEKENGREEAFLTSSSHQNSLPSLPVASMTSDTYNLGSTRHASSLSSLRIPVSVGSSSNIGSSNPSLRGSDLKTPEERATFFHRPVNRSKNPHFWYSQQPSIPLGSDSQNNENEAPKESNTNNFYKDSFLASLDGLGKTTTSLVLDDYPASSSQDKEKNELSPSTSVPIREHTKHTGDYSASGYSYGYLNNYEPSQETTMADSRTSLHGIRGDDISAKGTLYQAPVYHSPSNDHRSYYDLRGSVHHSEIPKYSTHNDYQNKGELYSSVGSERKFQSEKSSNPGSYTSLAEVPYSLAESYYEDRTSSPQYRHSYPEFSKTFLDGSVGKSVDYYPGQRFSLPSSLSNIGNFDAPSGYGTLSSSLPTKTFSGVLNTNNYAPSTGESSSILTRDKDRVKQNSSDMGSTVLGNLPRERETFNNVFKKEHRESRPTELPFTSSIDRRIPTTRALGYGF